VVLVWWLGLVLFAHSNMACRINTMIIAMEGRYAGRAAVHRAEALGLGAGGTCSADLEDSTQMGELL
jgi:hypothetical protein